MTHAHHQPQLAFCATAASVDRGVRVRRYEGGREGCHRAEAARDQPQRGAAQPRPRADGSGGARCRSGGAARRGGRERE